MQLKLDHLNRRGAFIFTLFSTHENEMVLYFKRHLD